MTSEIRLGTSTFTANGWPGVFYPKGTKSANYITYYATRFDTAEVDSTFYACPTVTTVEGWARKNTRGFHFFRQGPTHDDAREGADRLRC